MEKSAEELLIEGDELFEEGRYAEAVERYTETIAIDPAAELAHNNMGVALETMGKYEEAVREYEKAIKINPRYEIAWFNMGNSLFSVGRRKEAMEAYEKAVEINPDYLDAHVAKCNVLMSLGRKRAAIRYCEKIVERHETPEYLEAKAFVFEEADKYDKALETLDTALSFGPSAEIYNAKGNLLTLMERYEEAIENYNIALELETKNEEIWNNKGYAFFMIGLYDEAIACYDRSIEINPGYKPAWYNKGYTLHSIGRLEDAVECYRVALKYDDTDEVLWNNLGNALYNLGKYDESIPYFVKSIEANPNYEIAWNNIGNALDRMGKHEESIEYHEKALKINKKFDYALYAKGYALARSGNPEEGLDWIEKSLSINPKYDHAWFAKGHVLEMLGELQDAVEALKTALELNPYYPEAWRKLGDIYSELGRDDWKEMCEVKAKTSYRKILEEDPMDFQARADEIEFLTSIGEYDSVVERCDEWMFIRSGDTRPWKLMIDALLEMDEGKEALATLRRAERKGIEIDRTRKARIYMSMGHWEEAMEILREEDSEEASLLRAMAFYEREDMQRALEELRNAGNSRDKWVLKAAILERLRRCQEAIVTYENAKMYGEDSTLWLGIARCRKALGHHKKAKEAAEIALAMNREDKEVWHFLKNFKSPTEKREKAAL